MKKLTAILFIIITAAFFTVLPTLAADTDLVIMADKFSTVGMLEPAAKSIGGRTFIASNPDTSVTTSAFAFNYNVNIPMSNYAYAKVSYYCNTASSSANLRWDYVKAADTASTLESDGKHHTVIIQLKNGLADKKTLLQFLPFGVAKANTLDADIEFGLEYVALFATLEGAEAYDPEIEETEAETVVLMADSFSLTGALEPVNTRKAGHSYKKMVPDTTVSTGGFAGNYKNLQIDIAKYRYAKIGYRSNSASTGYLKWDYANCTPAISFLNTQLCHSETVVALNSGLSGTKSLFQIAPFGSGKANTLDGNAEFHLEYVALFGNLEDAEAFEISPQYFVTTEAVNTEITIISGVADGFYTEGDISFTVTPKEGDIIKSVSYTQTGGTAIALTADNGVYKIPASEITEDILISTSAEEEIYEFSVKIVFSRAEGKFPSSDNLAVVELSKDGTSVITVTENAELAKNEITFDNNLKPGVYRLKVTKNGYITYDKDIIISEDTNLEINLISGDIKGKYEDACGDGVVDIDDFIRVLRGFTNESNEALKKNVDINEDGEVNVMDLGYVKSGFGKTTESYK